MNQTWNSQDIEDVIARDKMLCDTIHACTEALCLAMPYITPLAAKNSAKGDKAISVLSHISRSLDMVREISMKYGKVAGNG